MATKKAVKKKVVSKKDVVDAVFSAVKKETSRLKKMRTEEANGQYETEMKPSSDDRFFLKPYETHGISFTRVDGKEHKAECPYCGKESFSVNQDRGVFKCWDCGKAGNQYIFLQSFYDECYKATTATHLKRLSKNRGLPVEVFEMAEVAYDSNKRRWLIPVRNREGSLVNLRHWEPEKVLPDGKKPYLMNTGGCAGNLYNLERLDESPNVIICEGEWDCMAMEWLLLQNKQKLYSVVAAPGADTFKPEWAKHFADKNIFIIYDNDDAGSRGAVNVADVLRKETRCKSIRSLKWPESYPDKFDARDYISKNVKKPKKAFAELKAMFNDLELHDEKSLGLVRTTFKEVVKDFKKSIHLSKDMEDALAIIISVVFSNVILDDPYCPVWMFLTGPSGSGKTLLIESVTDNHLVNCQDKITANSLVSMYKTPDGSDASLLPKLIGKTLMVKDWTVIMRLPQGDQEVIHSVMRAAFDGRFDASSGIGINRTYPEPGSGHDTCHFTFAAGVTNDIYLENRTSVGERSLKFQVFRDNDSVLPHLEAASNNTIKGESPETLLRASANAFIEHRLSQPKKQAPTVPAEYQRRVLGLAQISCIISANVHRKSGELLLRPAPTVGTRMVKTLLHLGQSLAFTFDRPALDEDCYRIMQTVALDTCYGWHRDVLLAVRSKGDKGILRDEIMQHAQAASSTVHRCLEDMFELGAVRFEVEGSGSEESYEGKRSKAGQPPKRWFLTSSMKELFDIAKISVPTHKFPVKGSKSFKTMDGANSSLPRKKTVKKKASAKKVVKKKSASTKLVKKKSVGKTNRIR